MSADQGYIEIQKSTQSDRPVGLVHFFNPVTVKRNIIANFSGSAWSALMSLAFVPFYIRLMGVESYGIVGVFSSLTAMLAVLDLGLSQAMSREMALLCGDKSNTRRIVDTARTLEVIYWLIALGVVTAVILLSDFIAYRWLNPERLSRDTLRQVLGIMALVIGLRWPVAIYMGGLNGLQRQVLVNILSSVIATLQGVGSLAVLWFFEPTARVFFLWHALIAVIQAIAFRIALWRSFSTDRKGTFCKEVLHNVWRFAAGMTGISMMATILTQMDKILLSRMLTLTDFGYYTFATTIAAVIYRIVGPVFTAYYPRLTTLVAKNDYMELVDAYHQGCQLMAVMILPATFVLAFFSREILALWSCNVELVENSSLLVSLLVIGNALNGLMHIPYALQLAHGWTKFAFYTNVIAVIFLVPAIYFATIRWGVVGAAGVWITLNVGYILVGAQIMYCHLLVGEKWRWYSSDIGRIMLPVLVVMGVARQLMQSNLGGVAETVIFILVFWISTIAAFFCAGNLHKRLNFNG
ncbi:oligosaccharide flippase family protein [Methylomonas sp. SURF-2]|uniref:Oligosaccharide flippase family protein n=1 Tax=Methylomonas subterranea TaxID=2952225 RepID=A0ABT1TJR1_9GAMM|nr:oligosaccharide flippase family protein [Methylomonas sp. SURF-2]MCQ8105483.1 oligosaccharide flippase family protein [Methylomonas sp. SURF-2]